MTRQNGQGSVFDLDLDPVDKMIPNTDGLRTQDRKDFLPKLSLDSGKLNGLLENIADKVFTEGGSDLKTLVGSGVDGLINAISADDLGLTGKIFLRIKLQLLKLIASKGDYTDHSTLVRDITDNVVVLCKKWLGDAESITVAEGIIVFGLPALVEEILNDENKISEIRKILLKDLPKLVQFESNQGKVAGIVSRMANKLLRQQFDI